MTYGNDPKFRRLVLFFLTTALLIALNPITMGAVLVVIATLLISRINAINFSRIVGVGILSVLLGVFLFISENYLRRGDPLNFGYTGESFTTPIFTGFAGLFFSPTRGIIFFIPPFFLGLLLLRKKIFSRGGLLFIRLSLVYSIALLLIYSKWHDWHGGWYWGPRYLLPLSIFGSLYFAILIKTHWSRATAASKSIYTGIALISFFLYKNGVAIHQKHLLPCWQKDPLSQACYWDFRYLPYSSIINGDLHTMLVHRSTIVEIAGILLFTILMTVAARGSGKAGISRA